MTHLARWLDLVLKATTLTILVLLALVVLLGVAFRYSGNSLIWYDEVASVLLAWITFTGAGLATLKDAHLGFNGLLFGLPRGGRILLFWLVEAIFLATFAIIGWAGWAILEIFGNETLVSVRWVTRAFVQGILPVSAAVIVLARLCTFSERYTAVLAGVDPETREIEQEIARAEEELRSLRERGETGR
ncbi:MAG: TRAP transporter small permease subunit [Geminicoccaceae bacterium]|nr:TRAP transporter small permease subunit [Geminicoccaceae bacterium]